jgi:hypothetical protein
VPLSPSVQDFCNVNGFACFELTLQRRCDLRPSKAPENGGASLRPTWQSEMIAGDAGCPFIGLRRRFRFCESSFPLFARRVSKCRRRKDGIGHFKSAVAWAVESICQADLRKRRHFSFADWAINHWGSPEGFPCCQFIGSEIRKPEGRRLGALRPNLLGLSPRPGSMRPSTATPFQRPL